MAVRVLSVKVDEDVITALGQKAARLGTTRHRLAVSAVKAAVDLEDVRGARERRVGEALLRSLGWNRPRLLRD